MGEGGKRMPLAVTMKVQNKGSGHVLPLMPG